MKHFRIILLIFLAFHLTIHLSLLGTLLDSGLSERKLFDSVIFWEKVQEQFEKAGICSNFKKKPEDCNEESIVVVEPIICIHNPQKDDEHVTIRLIRPFHIYEIQLKEVYNSRNKKIHDNFILSKYFKQFCEVEIEDNEKMKKQINQEINKIVINNGALTLDENLPERTELENALTKLFNKTGTINVIEASEEKPGLIEISYIVTDSIPEKRRTLVPIHYRFPTKEESQKNKLSEKSLTFSTIYFENTVEFTLSDPKFIQDETKRVLLKVLKRYVHISNFVSSKLTGKDIKTTINCADVMTMIQKAHFVQFNQDIKSFVIPEEFHDFKKIITCGEATENKTKYSVSCSRQNEADTELESLVVEFKLKNDESINEEENHKPVTNEPIVVINVLKNSLFQMVNFVHAFVDEVDDEMKARCGPIKPEIEIGQANE